jgi:iron(III) transport system substrate-binding protein
MRVKWAWGVAALLGLGAAACGGESGEGAPARDGEEAGVVNVYSHRHYDADRELFRRFTESTGIEVNVVTASADELITRLRNEGSATPADVLITVDAGRLDRAAGEGLLQAVESEVLEANVPAHLRDPEGNWYGLTRRARVLVYHRDRVDGSELSGYGDLADPAWEGRVLVRSSSNVYNQSLLAELIAREGQEAAESWAEGVARNMARSPRGGDTDQLKAVAAGVGDVALVNTYYLGRLAESSDGEDRRVASVLAPYFPEDDWVHVNVSGAGVTAASRNVENAVRLIEFLTEPEAQAMFAEANQEYPVNPEVAPSPVLQEWGGLPETDATDLSRLDELNGEAVRIFDRAGWR